MTAAEVLSKHRYAKAACDGCCKSYGYPDRHAAHQIDALRAAGYAVVELPKPVLETANGQKWSQKWSVGFLPVWTEAGGVSVGGIGPQPPSVARGLGAAILAAADAAEVS